ncbi:VOC family protein [Devosia sp.]|uniref:VOC family protein n=1 Tax=Devosia sp. TaxID=1871048 RepID=UPI002FC74494
MSTSIFVNLPVADLDSAKAFFSKLGFTFNAQFTNDTAAALVIDDTIYFMLVTKPKFAEFITLPIAEAKEGTQALYGISRDSRAAVDDIVDKALAAGGTEPRPAQDHGFMYSRAFADLDGHIWDFFWMDMSQFPAA